MLIWGIISAVAGIVNAITTIFAHGSIDEQLNKVLRQLQELRNQIITATIQVLEAINGLRLEIEAEFADTAMALADRALFSDAVVFNDAEQALGNSFEAADRLFRRLETQIVYLSSFMYVVTLRIAILKQMRPGYYCEAIFRDEFQRYIDRANFWIQSINDAITASHTVTLRVEHRGPPRNPELGQNRLVVSHLRNGVIVESFFGNWGDESEATAESLTRQANDSRARGIQKDRQDFGVVDMEKTVAAWRDAFQGALRAALVSQVLNRPAMAIDLHPDGLMVDGRILAIELNNLRDTLLEMLSSREFRNQIASVWDAFVNHGDDRLVRFAHRRLFNRDATSDEIALLRGIASHYGYGSFIANLIYGNEYEKRYGRGLPPGGEPVVKGLQSAK